MTKSDEYRAHIDEHISNIRIVWEAIKGRLTGDHCVDDLDFAILGQLVNKHDQSKYLSEEFHGYQQWFFPEPEALKSEAFFKSAWNWHQKRNPHHWEFWVLVNGADKDEEILAMPFIYVFEMLMDWSAMSLKLKDKPSIFYEKNKLRMKLHEDTVIIINHWIKLFDNVVEAINKL